MDPTINFSGCMFILWLCIYESSTLKGNGKKERNDPTITNGISLNLKEGHKEWLIIEGYFNKLVGKGQNF